MARAKQNGSDGGYEADKQQAAFDFTPGGVVTKLIKTCASFAEEIGELSGQLREALANAVEKKKLHKKAFARVRAELKMSGQQRLEYFAHYDHYAAVTEVRKISLDDIEDDKAEPEAKFSDRAPKGAAKAGAHENVG